jgi:hypothetical protein
VTQQVLRSSHGQPTTEVVDEKGDVFADLITPDER